MATSRRSWRGPLAMLPALCFLALVPLALAWSSSAADVWRGVTHPMFWPALRLSLGTATVTMILVMVFGSPLAWWMAQNRSIFARLVAVLVELPMILPPAVVGIALLFAYGRQGLLGSWLTAIDVSIPFHTTAVIIAQCVVASPFYIQAARAAFERVDEDVLLVAQTLGRSRARAIFEVGVPMTAPGILAGAIMCWARAIGEFGATLLFAGNQPGVTQTMPLAIYTALSADVRVAVALSLTLAAVCLLILMVMRFVPSLWHVRGRS